LLVASQFFGEARTEFRLEPLGHRPHPPAVHAPPQAGYVADHLAPAEAAKLGQLAGHVADKTLDLDRPRLAVHAEDLGSAAGGPDHVHEQSDRRGLARTVRAQVAEDLASSHLKVEVEHPTTPPA